MQNSSVKNYLAKHCWKGYFEISSSKVFLQYTSEENQTSTLVFRHNIKDVDDFIKFISDVDIRLSHTNDLLEFSELCAYLISNYDLKIK